jgi:hypothetical protein
MAKRQAKDLIYRLRLSPHQYNTMRAIKDREVKELGYVNQTTVGALVKRGLVFTVNDKAQISPVGIDAMKAYMGAPPMRINPGDVTERVSTLLTIINRRMMKRVS